MAVSTKVQKVAKGTAKLLVVMDAHNSAVNVTWPDLNGASGDAFVTGGTYANEENVFGINRSPGDSDLRLDYILSTLDDAVKVEFGNGDACITLAQGSFNANGLGIKSTGTVDSQKALVITPTAATNGTIVIGLSADGAIRA